MQAAHCAASELQRVSDLLEKVSVTFLAAKWSCRGELAILRRPARCKQFADAMHALLTRCVHRLGEGTVAPKARELSSLSSASAVISCTKSLVDDATGWPFVASPMPFRQLGICHRVPCGCAADTWQPGAPRRCGSSCALPRAARCGWVRDRASNHGSWAGAGSDVQAGGVGGTRRRYCSHR